MKAIYDPRQRAHNPSQFMALGVMRPNPEQPERTEILQAGAEAAGCTFIAPEDAGLGPIAALHSPEYLTFLQTIHARWSEIEGAGPEVISHIKPGDRRDSYPRSALGQAGYHQADTSCPINADTWGSAYWSAQTAISAADLVAGGERAAYALCRPPGHRAFGDMAGGFCFLNNSGIAAQLLRDRGLRPAILDVDVHHGNGTQGLFYDRDDVLTLSIHADPADFYPFFWGHSSERGEGRGRGYNLNLPLPRGTDDAPFLAALQTCLERVHAFGADVLVIALGLDASEDDPFQGFQVTGDGFSRVGEAIARAGLPTLFVQEGGYISDSLGHNLTCVLGGFTSAAR